MKTIVFVVIIFILGGGYLLFFNKRSPSNEENQNNMGNIILKSSAFGHNDFIPKKFTCEGENINPPLEIQNVPDNTKSLVLIVDDPDATGGITWDHWLVWNIDSKTQYIQEDDVPMGASQGTTSFGETKYGGPCPPKGSNPHRYMFKLYTLDVKLNLSLGATKSQIEEAMDGHILGQTVLTGLYERR